MKKIFLILLFAASFGLISCGGDEDCQICTILLTPIETTVEICPDGDDVKATYTAGSETITETLPDITVSEYVDALSSAGHICN